MSPNKVIKGIYLVVQVETEDGCVYTDSIRRSDETVDRFFGRGKIVLEYLIHKNELKEKAQ